MKQRLLDYDAPACIVNALAQSDLDVFSAGAWAALLAGKRILFRAAASFINSFGCIPAKEPLSISALRSGSGKGGLIVVGSFVEKTTIQLEFLLANSNVRSFEMSVRSLLTGSGDRIITEMATRIEESIAGGQDVVVYTFLTFSFQDG